jgi:hypothetical protein
MKEQTMIEGTVHDRLKIWADATRTAAWGATLRRMQEYAGLTAKAFANDIGLNRTHVYQERIRVSGKVQARLKDLERVIDNAFALFEDNEEKVIKWLFSPSRRFYNMTPFSMVMAGKGDTVYHFQENLRYDQGQGPQGTDDRNN